MQHVKIKLQILNDQRCVGIVVVTNRLLYLLFFLLSFVTFCCNLLFSFFSFLYIRRMFCILRILSFRSSQWRWINHVVGSSHRQRTIMFVYGSSRNFSSSIFVVLPAFCFYQKAFKIHVQRYMDPCWGGRKGNCFRPKPRKATNLYWS